MNLFVRIDKNSTLCEFVWASFSAVFRSSRGCHMFIMFTHSPVCDGRCSGISIRLAWHDNAAEGETTDVANQHKPTTDSTSSGENMQHVRLGRKHSDGAGCWAFSGVLRTITQHDVRVRFLWCNMLRCRLALIVLVHVIHAFVCLLSCTEPTMSRRLEWLRSAL